MGLEKLVSSENAVGVMQVELQELKPKLIESGKEVAALMEVIDKETIEANKVRGLLDF
jgi:dynein heavy chain